MLLVVAAHGTEMTDSVYLPEVEISVSRVRHESTTAPMQVSVLDAGLMEDNQVISAKDITALVPNVHMPDYGSAMTSSIYIRGLGSRINEPVLAVVVDGVPLMDKNMYDHRLQDIQRMELLRGPQGSLYGRNSPAGVLEIRTLLPLDLTTYAVKAKLSYGTANSVEAQAGYYQRSDRHKPFGWGITLRYNRTDGFHTNTYNGQKVDYGQGAGGRIVLDACPANRWRLTGTIYTDWLRQGAFPYAGAQTHVIAYNREGGYERLAVIPSLRAAYKGEHYAIDIVGSYQFMQDLMKMDQDYTTADIFTMQQRQKQHNATADILVSSIRPIAPKRQAAAIRYHWQAGMSAFVKTNSLSAPVTFMREGIEELILSNANRGIRSVFPDDSIAISNNELLIPGHFGLYNAGAALYHQSRLQINHWNIYAAIRLDYEYTAMDYLSTADVSYRFTLLMDGFENVHTSISGNKHAHYLQVLPRIGLSYERAWGTIYAYAAKGYKAGGYNPQIFSTVTQNQVMTDMAAHMGIHLNVNDPKYSDVSITAYRPERDWTFEAGVHLFPVDGLKIDFDVFHIRAYDQQLTVFPNGKTTGRMMTNAARSRIWGAEAALQYRWFKGKWSGIADASYGFTDARFVEFSDGLNDYAGNYIPYAPQHTMHTLVSAAYSPARKWLQKISASVRLNVTGPIWWNESNTVTQNAYPLLSANITVHWKYVSLQLWSRNLTGTHYNVFYFRSMGNDFLQQGKPRELGATLKLEL